MAEEVHRFLFSCGLEHMKESKSDSSLHDSQFLPNNKVFWQLQLSLSLLYATAYYGPPYRSILFQALRVFHGFCMFSHQS